jgi:hypothetical protein
MAIEYTAQGLRALSDVPLLVRTGSGSYVYRQVTTDATGRYSLSAVPAGSAVSIAPAPGSGYYAPCPNGRGVVHSDTPIDVYVVSAALLSTIGAPDLPRLGAIWISGTVFERTPEGTRPVPGVLINMGDSGADSSDPRLGSTTLTNAAGSYLLCPPLPGHGTDVNVSVRAKREGYRPATRTATLAWDYTGVDIELVPD